MSSDALAHFANFKLAGDRIVREAVLSFQSAASPASQAGRSDPRSGRGSHGGGNRRRRRRIGSRNTARVGAMSDADLEAELAARRTARAAERQRYARAMRSEKLAALEGELERLRGEISKIDPALPRRGAGGGGTSSNDSRVTWSDLPEDSQSAKKAGAPVPSPKRGAPPPPPGPPPPLVADLGKEEDRIDPETQRKEKAERQRRREEKRKAREAAAKPMTLADIIRSAGPDPVKRLKPRSEKVEDAPVQTNALESLKDSLKKVQAPKEVGEKGAGETTTKETGETDTSKSDSVAKDGNDVEAVSGHNAPPPNTSDGSVAAPSGKSQVTSSEGDAIAADGSSGIPKPSGSVALGRDSGKGVGDASREVPMSQGELSSSAQGPGTPGDSVPGTETRSKASPEGAASQIASDQLPGGQVVKEALSNDAPSLEASVTAEVALPPKSVCVPEPSPETESVIAAPPARSSSPKSAVEPQPAVSSGASGPVTPESQELPVARPPAKVTSPTGESTPLPSIGTEPTRAAASTSALPNAPTPSEKSADLGALETQSSQRPPVAMTAPPSVPRSRKPAQMSASASRDSARRSPVPKGPTAVVRDDPYVVKGPSSAPSTLRSRSSSKSPGSLNSPGTTGAPAGPSPARQQRAPQRIPAGVPGTGQPHAIPATGSSSATMAESTTTLRATTPAQSDAHLRSPSAGAGVPRVRNPGPIEAQPKPIASQRRSPNAAVPVAAPSATRVNSAAPNARPPAPGRGPGSQGRMGSQGGEASPIDSSTAAVPQSFSEPANAVPGSAALSALSAKLSTAKQPEGQARGPSDSHTRQVRKATLAERRKARRSIDPTGTGASSRPGEGV